jgi:hypothetical protein
MIPKNHKFLENHPILDECVHIWMRFYNIIHICLHYSSDCRHFGFLENLKQKRSDVNSTKPNEKYYVQKGGTRPLNFHWAIFKSKVSNGMGSSLMERKELVAHPFYTTHKAPTKRGK